MIREIFSILTQGVEVKQYDVERKTNLARVGTKIIWMVSFELVY